MSLRTRLILAFFLLSVVPLTAVTLYSYQSSERALREAAEKEGRQAAVEMGKRMELVTEQLSEQMDRLWDMPSEPLRATSDHNPHRVVQVARALGTTASLLDRIEFVPGPPRPPARPPVRVAPPAGAPPPPPPAPPAPAASGDAKAKVAGAKGGSAGSHAILTRANGDRVVIDLSAALAEAGIALRGAGAGAAGSEWVSVVAEGLAESLQAGAAVTAEGMRLAEQQLAKRVGEPKVRKVKSWASMTQGAMGLPIERQGKVLGTVTAKLNVERVLGTVFALARTDQGEVPFAIDEQGRLFTPKKAHKPALHSLGVTHLEGAAGATKVESRDKWLVIKRRDESGLTFGIARPLGHSLEALRRATVGNLMLGLLFIGVALVGIVPLSRRMTRDLSTLAAGAGEIAKGNFGVRVPVRSDDEIGRLSDAFNRMAQGVETHQKLVVEQERLQRELDLCRRIQAEMLPHGPLNVGFAEVKGVSIPAREVGGDFFNYFVLDNGEVAVLVGDVSGKGVGAALLMANVQATLRARLPLERDLAALVDAIDRDIDERTPGGVYVTLFVGILNRETRELRYVNAGHHPQFLLRRDGGVFRMPSAGLPVGLYAGHGYTQHEVIVSEGDLLFFYTDGTVETENETGEMFTLERLEAMLAAQHDGDLDTVLARVETALRGFRGRAELFDDATMMALRVGPAAR